MPVVCSKYNYSNDVTNQFFQTLHSALFAHFSTLVVQFQYILWTNLTKTPTISSMCNPLNSKRQLRKEHTSRKCLWVISASRMYLLDYVRQTCCTACLSIYAYILKSKRIIPTTQAACLNLMEFFSVEFTIALLTDVEAPRYATHREHER